MRERARHVAPVQTNAILDPPGECALVCRRPGLSLYFANISRRFPHFDVMQLSNMLCCNGSPSLCLIGFPGLAYPSLSLDESDI